MNERIITDYDTFTNYNNSLGKGESLFLIVEYSPEELGFEDARDFNYISSVNRYSLMRNECLQHPQDFKNRLNEHKYRIWLGTPEEILW